MSVAIDRVFSERQLRADGVEVRLAGVTMLFLSLWLYFKLMSAIVLRQTWHALAGFAAGTGAAMDAGGRYEASVVAGLVAGAVAITAKLLDLWWKNRSTKGERAQALSSAQQQSADKVAELTVEERQDLRKLMNEIYGRERALLEYQITTMQAQRTQDVQIIDGLSSQLRIAQERLAEFERRQGGSLTE